MIYLTTGANGAGKTLLMLADVRKQQLAENRPVYYHGFEALDPIKSFGWLPFEPKDWMGLPDGSICVMDECQNEFPLRRSGAEVPQYVADLAEFRRKRGFDMWMTTPHPMLIDVNVRRLIGAPSWHRHLKRAFGGDMVSVSKWSAVKTDCEKPGAGATGETRLVPFPKEVYGWYRSASLHTGKKKVPFAAWVVLASLVLVPALGAGAYWRFHASTDAIAAKVSEAGRGGAPAGGGFRSSGRSSGSSVKTQADFLRDRAPRLEGFAFTAPVYDGVTAVTDAPYPAACISSHSAAGVADCRCWSQQATRLAVPAALCQQIASQGYFMDWRPSPAAGLIPGGGSISVPSKPVPVASAPAPAAGRGSLVVFSAPFADQHVASVQAVHDGLQLRRLHARSSANP